MAIGDELLNFPQIAPAAPATPLPPGMTPEQFAAQLGGYRDAFTGIPSPQAGNEAMLRLGLGLLRPVQPGDTAGGVFSRAGQEAQDYYRALRQQEQQNALMGMQFGQRERALRGQEAQTAEQIAASQLARGVTAARAPVEQATAEQGYRDALQKYQTAKRALDLIDAEEAAGIRSPDFLKRKAQVEIEVREALADMYKKHGTFYEKAGEAKGATQRRQAMNVQKVEDPMTGATSIVTNYLIDGEPYTRTVTLPRFVNERQAREFAQKEVDKETPSAWNPFAGKAPYAGTAAEEVERRVKEYMSPTVRIIGPKGNVSEEEFGRLGTDAGAGPGPGGGAKTLTAPPPAPGSTAAALGSTPAVGGITPQAPQPGRPMPAAFPQEGAEKRVQGGERSLGIIRTELRDARQRKAPAEEIAALEREEKRATELMKGGASTFAPGAEPAAGRIRVVQDAQGNLVRQGAPAQAPVAAPQVGPPAPVSPVETKGVALDRARATLHNARAAAMRYGVRAQRDDPTGYRAALADLARAQAAVATAQEEYEAEVAPNLPFARQPLRRP